MEDRARLDTDHDWERMLNPGVCWFIWNDEETALFCLCTGEGSSVSSSDSMQVELVFPPDIAYLIHEILRDATEMKPGDSKRIRLTIPGTDSVWPGYLSRLYSGRFTLLWSEKGNGVHEFDTCDIMEHIRSERAVRKANEKLNLFNAIVRHDITNLMMGIVGYIDIIDEIVSDEEVRLLLRKSRDLGDRVKRVTELTRTYQDLGIRPPSFVEAESTVYRITDRHEFVGKISAEVNLKGLFLYVDRMFDVVIYEVVRNSLQYGGEAVTIHFSYTVSPDHLTLIVEDSGPGVHPDYKERIFVRNYADRKGYGLYLAAEILDITGVTIRETGTFGEGARFELSFPHDTYRFEDY